MAILLAEPETDKHAEKISIRLRVIRVKNFVYLL